MTDDQQIQDMHQVLRTIKREMEVINRKIDRIMGKVNELQKTIKERE